MKGKKTSIFDEPGAPLYVQIKKGTRDIKCPKCKGPVWVDGEMERQLPIGFGFQPGDTRFRVDAVRYKGWIGQCEKCKNKVFAWHTKSMVTKHPAFGTAKKRPAGNRKPPRLTR